MSNSDAVAAAGQASEVPPKPSGKAASKKPSGGTEAVQELGRKGVHRIKDWLESTTRFRFFYTIYDRQGPCMVTCLSGDKKTFDIEGQIIDGMRPLSVECKNYSTPGAQGKEFRKFIAIAYSATMKELAETGSDPEREFMWVTTHPFSQRDWKKLSKLSYARSCVTDHPEYLEESHVVDEDVLADVANRLWILVGHKKQMALRLSKRELRVVHDALDGLEVGK